MSLKERTCKACKRDYVPTGANQKYCKPCGVENAKRIGKECDKRLYKKKGRIKTFGLTEQQYDQMLSTQDECCAICGKHQKEFKRSFAVDHCHTTEKIRGLLCMKCNLLLGYANDNIDILASAIRYLDRK